MLQQFANNKARTMTLRGDVELPLHVVEETETLPDLLNISLDKRREMDQQDLLELSSIAKVSHILSSPAYFTKIAATVSEKYSRTRKRKEEQVNVSQRVVGWEGLRETNKTRKTNKRVNMAIIDQKEELLDLR